MIYPSIDDLTKGKYNRYELVIATAKCARIVTDEYIKQRETAEKLIADKQTDKSLSSMIKREYRDEKAVKNAINRLYTGEFVIVQKTPEQIAAEVFDVLARTVARLLSAACEKARVKQALVVGGVASSTLLRGEVLRRLSKQRKSIQVLFGQPQYSADNAAGVAAIGMQRLLKQQ